MIGVRTFAFLTFFKLFNFCIVFMYPVYDFMIIIIIIIIIIGDKSFAWCLLGPQRVYWRRGFTNVHDLGLYVLRRGQVDRPLPCTMTQAAFEL